MKIKVHLFFYSTFSSLITATKTNFPVHVGNTERKTDGVEIVKSVNNITAIINILEHI